MNTYSRRFPLIPALLKRALVPVLFVLLASLQILDLHSTLTAGPAQFESNRLIAWASQWAGLTAAVIAVKLIDALLIGGMWFLWKRSQGQFQSEFTACLAVACAAYAFVVTNNYLH